LKLGTAKKPKDPASDNETSTEMLLTTPSDVRKQMERPGS
jgi:hypothetical protein